MVVIKTKADLIIGGCFIPGLEISSKHYGTGECFIFKWLEKEQEMKGYFSTGENTDYAFGDLDGLGMGSDPGFGIFMMSTLKSGFSMPCKTYNSPQLYEKNDRFEIKTVEVWALSPQLQN